jgi:hypothetical protein
MKSTSRLAFAAAVLAVAGDAMMSKAYSGVGCEIRTSRHNEGTRLEAVISATGPVAGSYVLTVSHSGSSTPKLESGDFEITGQGRSEVKKAGIDLPPGESYSASLDVKWPGGSSLCSASGS